MNKFRNVLLAGVLMQLTAFGADPGLLKLVMPDAKVLAGVQVAQAKNSPFGQYVLSRMQPDDAGFQQFLTDTGFDPRRDLTEVLMASNWQGDSVGQWLVLARGSFNPAMMASAVQRKGGTVTPFMGVSILSGVTPVVPPAKGGESVVAFLDNSTAVMGDPDSVKATIQRSQGGAAGEFTAPDKVNQVSAKYDFWFLTLVPVSEFAGLMPDQNMSQAMQGNLFQAILQASGGVKFGAEYVLLSAEAVTRSDKDAASLVDVVKFIAGMLQSNKNKNSTATQFSTLLDTMSVQSTGSTMTMALSVPEPILEQLFQNSEVRHQARNGKHPVAAPVQ